MRTERSEKKSVLVVLIIMLLASVGGTIWVLKMIGDTGSEIAAAEESRFQALQLTDLLRQTSDDLTKLARTCVVTGDERT